MRKLLIAVISAAMVLAGSMALAASGSYYGISYSSIDVDADGAPDDANIDSLIFSGGKFVHPNMALEFRAGLGIDHDKVGGQKVELDYLLGGYARVVHQINQFTPYFLAGVTNARVSAGSDDETKIDLSFGIGVDVEVSPNLGVNVEYASYIDKSDLDITGVNIGLRFLF